MIAIIVGLGAVVFLVVAIVTIGIRSGRRRESNLTPERIKAMAEGKTKRLLTRPAEDTFFESFPEDFDSLDDEPEERRRSLRPSLGKSSGKGSEGKASGTKGSGQRSGGRKKRGDEWGDSADDYDDDYWTRVRDEESGGPADGTQSAPRPAGQSSPAGSSDAPPPPLPTRQSKNLADLVESGRATPSTAGAEDKTVRFPGPGATPAGAKPGLTPAGAPPGLRPNAAASPPAAQAQQPGAAARPASGRPGAAAGAPRPGHAPAGGPAGRPAPAAGPASRQPTGPGGAPRQPREGRSSRPGPRPGAAPARPTPLADPIGAGSGRPGSDPLTTAPRPAAASAGPDALGTGAHRRTPVDPLTTGPRAGDALAEPIAQPRADALADPLTTGPRPVPGPDALGTGAHRRTPADPLSTAPRPAAAAARADALDPLGAAGAARRTGEARGRRAQGGPSPASGSFPGAPAVSGSFPPTPAATPESGTAEPRRSPSEPFPAMPPASATPAGLMPDPPARSARRTPTPTGPVPAGTPLPETGVFSLPPVGSGSPTPAAGTPLPPAPTPTPQAGWPAVRDVLDDEPPPAASSRETWATSGYQTSFRDGYRPRPAAPVGSAGSSYEVSPGWATIDDSDTVTGSAKPDAGGDDVLSGRSYTIGGTGSPSAPLAWPEREPQAGLPSYTEKPGDAASSDAKTTKPRGRRGAHRGADPDYPDYYR